MRPVPVQRYTRAFEVGHVPVDAISRNAEGAAVPSEAALLPTVRSTWFSLLVTRDGMDLNDWLFFTCCCLEALLKQSGPSLIYQAAVKEGVTQMPRIIHFPLAHPNNGM